jgi:hypothetical protein
MNERLIEKDVERSGRGLLSRNLPGGTEENLRIAGLRAEIWTRDLPNMKQEC